MRITPTFTFIPPSGLTPKDSRICRTPWSVFQDGSLKTISPATYTVSGTQPIPNITALVNKLSSIACFEAAASPRQWRSSVSPTALTLGYNTEATFLGAFTASKTVAGTENHECTLRLSVIFRYWFQTFHFRQFHVLFNSLFKVLFIFPSRYLFAIGLSPLFSFRWYLPPILDSIPKLSDSLKTHHTEADTGSNTGFSPSLMPRSNGLKPRLPPKVSLETTIRCAKHKDFKFELFPLHSPLLRESLLVSFPPLIDMLKFSGSSCLI